MTRQGKRIIFIAGIILLIFPLNWMITYTKYLKAITAPYKKEVCATVIAVSKVESRTSQEEDISRLQGTQYAYVTREVFETELGEQEYKGYYGTPYNEGDTINHSAYRYEGDRQWTVSDMDEQDIIIKGAACFLFGLIGIAMMIGVGRMKVKF